MNLLLNPALNEKNNEFRKYCEKINDAISLADDEDYINTLLRLSREINSGFNKSLSLNNLVLLTAKSVTLDLVAQGWKIDTSSGTVQLNLELNGNETNIDKEKSRIRNIHLFHRNKQLLEKSVKEFIEKCERRKLHKNKWQSIYSLMRDGKDLSETIIKANQEKDENTKLKLLSNAIKPYIQIAEPDTQDEFTGMPLLDIWRYFRHTWVFPYKVLPGRSVAVLIRDAAAENHPVIGIAALGSPVAQFTQRDSWIGWESQSFLEHVSQNPTKKLAQYLLKMLSGLISGIYKKDLLDLGIINKENLQNPSIEIIQKLKKMADNEIKKHRKGDKDIFSKLKMNQINQNTDWEVYSKTSLYKSKRYRSLATLLYIRSIFNKYDFTSGKESELKKALQQSSFKQAIGQLVRKIKAENVGIKMMDIVVCGAIPPYNHILGGKLVCTLLFSPEIINYYRSKYSNSVSIIASCMSGKKVKRNQDLVLLSTTSLYGIGSSQYNRIKIPVSKVGGNDDEIIEYINLGFSKGYGSFHLSKETIDLIHHLVGRKGEGRMVNSIFGEGANPLMRKLREGLEIVGFPSTEILKHGNKRVLYCIPLAKNFREVLLGLEKKPKYFIKQSKAKLKTQLLIDYWVRRWFLNRVNNPKIIEDIQKHTLEYPITHGARVPKIEEQLSLFE